MLKRTTALAIMLGLASTASAHELAKGPNGGPLVDVYGNVVGVVDSKLNSLVATVAPSISGPRPRLG